MGYTMSQQAWIEFRQMLIEEEKTKATVDKYMHDLKLFQAYIENQEVTKERMIGFKQMLMERYAPSSVNSILASVNGFLKVQGWYDCIVKSLKIQREAFRLKDREMSKEEYYRLLEAAKKKKSQRLYYLMQTICSTGIRVSELPFITVESLNARRATVSIKGKIRTILLPKTLCKKLKQYVRQQKIASGPIFITKSGKPVDRSNIVHEMKALAEEAGVSRNKIFPHNLRHLFACVFYQMEKDIFRLADILGHSNINTTRIYTQISCEIQEKRMDRLALVQ